MNGARERAVGAIGHGSDPTNTSVEIEQRFESTVARPFTLAGRGLHGNARARVTVAPAPEGSGLSFSVGGCRPVTLCWRNRAASRLNTALHLPGGGMLRTVEHLSASLSAFGVDNARITVEGREIPILDGSALPWCEALAEAGIAVQARRRRYIRILRPFQVELGNRFVRAEPAARLEIDATGEHYLAGSLQAWHGPISREAFVRELAPSRSSGRINRAWHLAIRDRLHRMSPSFFSPPRQRGFGSAEHPEANAPRPALSTPIPDEILARLTLPAAEPVLRGALPGRVVIWVGTYPLGGRRFEDERIRHKALDMLGDLALAGGPLLGRFVTHRPTHQLVFAFIATLMQSQDVWESYEA